MQTPTAIRIHLSGDPVGKGRPRFHRASGRAYSPEKTKQYESTLRVMAQHEMDGNPPLEGPLRVELFAVFAIPKSFSKKRREAAMAQREWPTKKPDADNLLKVIDALNGVVWLDDKQVIDARVRKFYGEYASLTIMVDEVVAT